MVEEVGGGVLVQFCSCEEAAGYLRNLQKIVIIFLSSFISPATQLCTFFPTKQGIHAIARHENHILVSKYDGSGHVLHADLLTGESNQVLDSETCPEIKSLKNSKVCHFYVLEGNTTFRCDAVLWERKEKL